MKESGNDRRQDVAKMRDRITQGTRYEADKEGVVLAAVRGDARRGGSVFR